MQGLSVNLLCLGATQWGTVGSAVLFSGAGQFRCGGAAVAYRPAKSVRGRGVGQGCDGALGGVARLSEGGGSP